MHTLLNIPGCMIAPLHLLKEGDPMHMDNSIVIYSGCVTIGVSTLTAQNERYPRQAADFITSSSTKMLTASNDQLSRITDVAHSI